MQLKTEVLVRVVVVYDESTLEYTAQQQLLEAMPEKIAGGTTATFVEIVAGCVDRDGVPIQPKVSQVDTG